MTNKKIKSKNPMKIVIAVAMIFSVVFFAVSVLNFILIKNFQKTALPVSATIQAITTDYDDDSHRVYVSYTVGGENYYTKLSSYSSSMKVGKQITVYYQIENPKKIMYPSVSYTLSLVFLGLSSIFLAITSVECIKEAQKRKMRKLKYTGSKVDAKIVGWRLNRNISVNGMHPLVIICQSVESGRIYESHNIYSFNNQLSQGDDIDLYISRDNTAFYVDADTYLAKNAEQAESFIKELGKTHKI